MPDMIQYFNLLKSLLNPKQVSFLIIYVTNRCNFNCDFCFYAAEIQKGLKSNELTLQEIEKVSQRLGPIIQLSLTGGEPFLREELSEITDIFIKNNYVKYITIPTNVSLPAKIENYFKRVLPKYPNTYFRLVFSINGVEGQHDLNCSVPGAYRKIQEGYAAVSPLREKYHNLVLDANSVYTSRSENTILETIQRIHNEFRFDNISITYARGDMKDPALRPASFQKYLEADDYLRYLKRTGEKRFLYPLWRAVRDVSREFLIKTVLDGKFISPCTAGKKILIITETGEVYPCEILKNSMGNVRDFGFNIKELISATENQKLLKWIKDSKCKCSFECALAANVLWGRTPYLKLLKASLKNIGKN